MTAVTGKQVSCAGDLVFKDGSRLHFREFIQVKRGEPVNRYMYAFHYMRADKALIFRYDNAPHHKYIGENDVAAADAPDLQSVLKEIEGLIDSKR